MNGKLASGTTVSVGDVAQINDKFPAGEFLGLFWALCEKEREGEWRVICGRMTHFDGNPNAACVMRISGKGDFTLDFEEW